MWFYDDCKPDSYCPDYYNRKREKKSLIQWMKENNIEKR